MITRTSDTVTRLQLGEREIILIGTAHISHGSVEEVEQTILAEKPDRVCVEIDAGRYATMQQGQNWSNLNIGAVLKQKKGFLLMANLVLSSFQRRMGVDLGITPGAELKQAIAVAERQGIPFSFIDREVSVTLRRAWALSSFWNKNKLLAALISAAFSKEKLSVDEIEALKKKNAVEGMMDELASYLPSVKRVLIDERDQFLATSLYQAPGAKIVAVVGAGHANGIIAWLQKLQAGEVVADLTEISSVPPPSRLGRMLPFLFPVLILGLFAAGFFLNGWEDTLTMLFKWALITGGFSAVGSLLALAHPLVILVSFLGAPITTLNPFIGIGFFTGPLQAILRKPRVIDFENLHGDIESLPGFYRNRFTHALLVFLLSSIGGSIGTFVGIPYLGALLGL